MRRWPYTLPGHSLDGFSQKPFPTAYRTDFDSGAARSRRRTRAKRFETGLTWTFTDAEFAAFSAWHLGSRVNLIGDSDTIAAMVPTNVTVTLGGLVGPDQMTCDLLTETTANGAHWVQTALIPELGFDGLNVVCHATLKAAGRGFAQVGLRDRANTDRVAIIDLTIGAVVSTSAGVTAKVTDRGDGWWAVVMTTSTGVGTGTPRMRIWSFSSATVGSFVGDPARGIGICEIAVRISTGFDLFVPSDATGAAKGSDGESGWFWYDMPMGGGLTRTECRFMEPYQSAGLFGFHWKVSAMLEVRYA